MLHKQSGLKGKKMRSGLICGMLFSMLLNSVSAQVMIVGTDGRQLLTNRPEIASQSATVSRLEKTAEGYIFPISGAKRQPKGRVERILTGIFSGSGSVDVRSEKGVALPDRLDLDVSPAMRRETVKDKDTIAWITKEGLLYHDPFLECPAASGSERVWVGDYHELCGLQPCEDCFQKNNNIPDFISKESGGLDVASAPGILTNAAFLEWAQSHLPIRNPGFISTQKLIIYPKMEMTALGLHQLARETELAYRRLTWKVIEVLGKQSEIDTGNISSFNSDFSETDVKSAASSPSLPVTSDPGVAVASASETELKKADD